MPLWRNYLLGKCILSLSSRRLSGTAIRVQCGCMLTLHPTMIVHNAISFRSSKPWKRLSDAYEWGFASTTYLQTARERGREREQPTITNLSRFSSDDGRRRMSAVNRVTSMHHNRLTGRHIATLLWGKWEGGRAPAFYRIGRNVSRERRETGSMKQTWTMLRCGQITWVKVSNT